MKPIRLAVVALSLAALAPSAALAAAPGATTAAATDVTSQSATLNGVVNPNKEDTTYHFEYGTTTSYGAVTPDAVVGGNAGKSVSAAITGLAPSTTYHFRLVATNASGADQGADLTFTTSAPGTTTPTLSIGAAPPLLTFGTTSTISGTLAGGQIAGVQVQLQQSPSPFTGPMTNVGAPVATDAAGNYSFAVGPALNTRYQAVAATSPPTTSATVDVLVRFRVAFRVSDTTVRRGRRVRFTGSVAPAATGRVRIQRRTRTGYRTVARAALRGSRFAKRLRIRRNGTYRVRVPGDAAHRPGTSRRRTIRIG